MHVVAMTVVTGCNLQVLDDNRELFIPETQQLVKAHPHFVLFGAQNPPGVYGGRKVRFIGSHDLDCNHTCFHVFVTWPVNYLWGLSHDCLTGVVSGIS